MSFCQWADGYHKGKSVGWWCMEGKKHTQESERLLEKIPVVHLIFKVFRLIFLQNMLGFCLPSFSSGSPLLLSPSNSNRTDPISPDQVQGCDLGPSNQIMTRTFTRSTGKKILSFSCHGEGCKPGAPEDHPCHLTGTLCLRMMPAQKRAEPRDKARTSGWHLRTWIQHYLKLPFFFSQLLKQIKSISFSLMSVWIGFLSVMSETVLAEPLRHSGIKDHTSNYIYNSFIKIETMFTFYCNSLSFQGCLIRSAMMEP